MKKMYRTGVIISMVATVSYAGGDRDARTSMLTQPVFSFVTEDREEEALRRSRARARQILNTAAVLTKPAPFPGHRIPHSKKVTRTVTLWGNR